MKKIITFLFCTTFFAAAFAQPDRRDNDYRGDHDRDYNNNTVYRHNGYNNAQKDMEIQRITNQYDYRIEQVACDRSLSHRERKFAIRDLREEKASQINNVLLRYSHSNVYNDWYNRDRDYRDRDFREWHHDND